MAMGCATAGCKVWATNISRKLHSVVLLKRETKRVSSKACRETDGRNSGREEIRSQKLSHKCTKGEDVLEVKRGAANEHPGD